MMAHGKLLKRQRQYLFTGGMPEAVLTFQESDSLQEVTAVHRRIVSTYEDDFAKYARRHKLVLLQRIFRMLPRQIGQKVKCVHYVISSGPSIFPVEIKAGQSGSLRSLHQFIALGKSETAIRFDLNPPSRQHVNHQVPTADQYKKINYELLSLPIYGVGELGRLIASE